MKIRLKPELEKLVEQDVQIALERAEHGYVIDNGRIVLEGSGPELLRSNKVRTAYLGEL